jgi:hypothetical protein
VLFNEKLTDFLNKRVQPGLKCSQVDVVTNLIGESQLLHKEMIVDHNESN